MEGLRPHTRDERTRLVAELVELHRCQLGDNLLGLATQGSYARGSDGAYSDIELVAFLAEVPGDTSWADCVQIWQGMLIDVIWTTKDEYISRVKEVTPAWHLAGSDHLGALINEALVEEINAYEVSDLRAKCLAEALRHWPVTQEAAGKLLNAIARGNTANVGRLLFAMLDAVLIDLAFLNERPYESGSTALDEARALPRLPRGFDELAAIAGDRGDADLDRVRSVTETVFAGLEELFAAQSVELYLGELVLRPVSAR